jgi:hypothetical protein
MRANAVQVITLGSQWFFDESSREYLRLPLTLEGLEDPSWGGASAGVLADGTWHEYLSWTTTYEPQIGAARLMIVTPKGTVCAPFAVTVGERGVQSAASEVAAARTAFEARCASERIAS